MSVVAKKNILQITPYLPGKPIEEVKRELGLKKVYKLASNESPFEPSPKVLKAVAQAAITMNRYPDGGCFELRQLLSQRLNVKPEQLVFGNGSDEVLVMAVRALVAPGDEVIIAKPSFLIYDIAAKLEGAVVRAIPLKDFRYDLDAMKAAVNSKTKVIFIGNPDNPAGTYITKTQAVRFLNEIPKQVLVVFDEAYFEFVDGQDYPDSIALLKKYPNLLVTRTFSKMYGLAGLRIGYGIACREFVEILNRVRDPFNINSIAQAAAIACLKDMSYYRRVAADMRKEKEYLYTSLTKLRLKFVPSSTNFILVETGNATDITQALLRKGIIVRNMAAWGLNSYIRVSIGIHTENQAFVKALSSIQS